MDIPVLFENENLLVVDKPEKIASIPERTPGATSVLEILNAERNVKLFVVHRLDKEVSGVLVFAKTPDIHKQLSEAFETRKVKKTYMALVHGAVKESSGVIDKPLREFGSGRMGVDANRGKPSETGYAIQARFERYTLLRLYPLTGRRHQLRVHLYSIGHPIVGDPLYGPSELQKKAPRLFLHAHSIGLPSSVGVPELIEAVLPASYRAPMDGITGPPVGR